MRLTDGWEEPRQKRLARRLAVQVPRPVEDEDVLRGRVLAHALEQPPLELLRHRIKDLNLPLVSEEALGTEKRRGSSGRARQRKADGRKTDEEHVDRNLLLWVREVVDVRPGRE